MVDGVKIVKSNKKYDYLEMKKTASAKAFFDDGLWFWLGDGAKPKHLKFYVQTGTQEKETCDVRLTSVKNLKELGPKPAEWTKAQEDADAAVKPKLSKEQKASRDAVRKKQEKAKMPWKYQRDEKQHMKDVAFFRMGYLNYMKLNTFNMVELSVGKKWYKIDLLINWPDQRVAIYVNDKFKASSPFFNNEKERVESSNVLSIYGLSAGGTSRFRGMEVCTDVCATGDATKLDMKHTNQAAGATALLAFNVMTTAAIAFMLAA